MPLPLLSSTHTCSEKREVVYVRQSGKEYLRSFLFVVLDMVQCYQCAIVRGPGGENVRESEDFLRRE